LTIVSGDQEAIVWLQKLNPVEHKTATKRANAAKSMALAAQYDETSDPYLETFAFVGGLSHEEKVDHLVNQERKRLYPVKLEELALEDPWKDGYLEGLRDLWFGDGLLTTHAVNPEDPEAKRVYEALMEYSNEASRRTEDELEAYRFSFQEMGDKELTQTVLRLFTNIFSDQAWLEEFQLSEIWLAVRYPEDHTRRYFTERKEVDTLQEETLVALGNALRELTVDPEEGKDSAAMPPSSA
jgi:hypothetical protein